jgi:pimeloyl-ACP methyl ester carboxylesterase
VAVDTVRLHGQEVAYRQSPGEGAPLVLVHGIGASSSTWDPVVDLLAETGRSVVTLDLPGHGRSSKERGDYSLGALASTVRDLLDHLDVPRAVVVGHSLGGGVAMQFTYQFPERVEGLVLVASGGLGEETFPLLRAATLPGAEIVLPLITHPRTLAVMGVAGGALSRIGLNPEALSADAVRTLQELDEPQARNAFLATLRGVVDFRGQRVSAVSKLSSASGVPTLLIWGDRDPVIPVEHGVRAHELLPDSRLVVFPGAGHEPHRFDPERFAELVAGTTPR